MIFQLQQLDRRYDAFFGRDNERWDNLIFWLRELSLDEYNRLELARVSKWKSYPAGKELVNERIVRVAGVSPT